VVKNDYCGFAAQRCSLLKEQEPSLRIELIDKAAHLAIWETADKFNEAALQFLKRKTGISNLPLYAPTDKISTNRVCRPVSLDATITSLPSLCSPRSPP